MAGSGAGFWRRAMNRWQRPVARDDGAPSSMGPSEMPGVDIAGYPLVRTFAHGALGELHLATDPATGAPLAIKTVRLLGSDRTRERFVRESQAAERLRHPAIVRCVGSGIEGRGDAAVGWIAMEWVAGTDLSRYASPVRLLPEPLVLELVAQAAEGLAHAHALGVVHRDIKPANLLFNPSRGTLKITDFGCAHLSDAERSRSGVLAGTPVYMAPEQLSGAPVDGRCDLYALGVVLFELLTGHLPFEASSMGELTAAISSAPPPAITTLRPDLPAALDDLIARLLAKAPAERHADGHQLAAELRQLAAALPTAASSGAITTGERHAGGAGTMVPPSRPAARPS